MYNVVNILKEKVKNIMGKKKNKSERNRSFWEHPAAPIVIPIIVSLLFSAIGTGATMYFGMYTDIKQLRTDMKEVKQEIKVMHTEITDLRIRVKALEVRVANLEKRMDKLEERMDKLEERMDKLEERMDKLEERVSNLEKTVYQSNTYIPATSFVQKLSSTSFTGSTGMLNIKDSDIIATDKKGRKYTAKKLTDKRMVLPYREGNQELYFYGQFNKKYHWNGNCIINAYENNKLDYIMEAFYEDGVLKFYRQVSWHKNNSKNVVWNISEREHNSDTGANTGDTWTYVKKKDIKKKFNKKNVKATNIMGLYQFGAKIKGSKLEGFYHGKTKNGSYSDKSGKAYLVKYASDGTVRTLYCGKFKDGKFYDTTGNAWYIARGANDKNYVYFKGLFMDGSPVETSVNKRTTISKKEIEKILSNRSFKCKINLFDSEKKRS